MELKERGFELLRAGAGSENLKYILTRVRGHLKLLERLVGPSLISVAVIKYPNRKQLMRERDIFA